MQLPGSGNACLAEPYPHVPEGRTRCSAGRLQCLTSLSEFKLGLDVGARLGKLVPRRGLPWSLWRTDQVLRREAPVVAFWTEKKLASNAAARLGKRVPRRALPPCSWRADEVLRWEAPVPNVAFWLQIRFRCRCQVGKTRASQRLTLKPLKDGPGAPPGGSSA